MSPYASMVVSSFGWTLVHFLWQGLLLGCATAVLLTLMRNTRPEHRYTVACTALFLCLAWPAIEFYLRMQDASAAVALAEPAGGWATAPGKRAEDITSYLQGNLAWIVALWAVCAGVLAVRIGLGLLWVKRAAHQYSGNVHWQGRVDRMAAQFGITRKVRLRVVENLASPITAGWWRPLVLVPASLISGMPAHLLEALLAHEMAHVRRFDYLVNLGQNVVETLLFYHPAVWWISGRVREEREQIADDIAASQLGEPRRLALALSELERFQFSSHHLAQAANGGDLMTRIKRLIRPDTQALNWKAAIPVLGLAAACLSLYANAAPDAAKAEKTRAVADFKSCAKPVWPAESLKNENQGTVTLSFLVGVDGKVKDSAIKKSSGFAPLDEAARSGIAKCSFKPATVAGQPVEDWMMMQYMWTLK
ncbi:M56 family metallopeptidase [Massilia sp. RP-1-19]|uniref:M56 family metallopeptidase n=1 Tax=Massilia polaris TaxID=2728846 RepID=A0A848HG08_9BURK|nr:M56 family metallopeptidase [Massilia polaris]NML60007.1 M56 family metallopeptidase [Massilia polaris]